MEVIINVKDVLNTNFAIRDEKSEELYKIINDNIKNNNRDIILDFYGIETSTTRFFDLLLDKLYFTNNIATIDNITIKNANDVICSQYEIAKKGAKSSLMWKMCQAYYYIL